MEELHQSGFKAIWMLDPGIKYEKGYFAYDSGSEADVWVQTADGRPYIGMCLSCSLNLFFYTLYTFSDLSYF